MLILIMWQLPCRCHFCQYRLPIRWLWITASKSLPKQPTYKTKNRWCSIDAHFQHGAVTMSISPLPIEAADTLIMDNSKQIASQTTYLQDQNSLTLRWRSFSGSAVTLLPSLLPIKAADTLVMDNSEQIASQLNHLHDQILWTLHWCSFSEWGCYLVAVCFAYKGWQYIYYG